jgi:uncharacterized cupin superfamily protein
MNTGTGISLRLGCLLLAPILVGSCAEKPAPAARDPIAIIDISPAPPADIAEQPVGSYSFMKVIEGDDPSYGARQDFVSTDGKLSVDYSQYTTMTLELVDWPADEFMLFVEGQVEITDRQGRSKTYGPGDMILMPRGFSGTWRQLGPIKKISVTYDWRTPG